MRTNRPVKGFCCGDVQFFVPNRKKPIASSTKATSDCLALLKAESSSWQELKGKLLYDREALQVIEAHEKLNVPFEAVKWK